MVKVKEQFYQMLMEAKGFAKPDEYGKKLNVSLKSIYNYLSDLDPYLKEYDLNLIRKSGKGIYIEGSQENKNELLNELIYGNQISSEERREQIYEDLLMREKVLSINKLAEDYYVSRSSIVNDFEEVEDRLRKHHLSLLRNNSGTSLTGEETNIRKAKISFVYSQLENKLLLTDDIIISFVRSKLTEYVDKEILELAEQMITYLKNELLFELNIIYYLQTLISFSIFLERIKGKHLIQKVSDRPFAIGFHELKTYPIAQQICDFVSLDLKAKIGQLDVIYVNGLINAVYKDDSDVKASRNSLAVDRIVDEMIDSVKDIFSGNISEDKLLINGLRKHVSSLCNRINNNITVSNPYLEQVKQQYNALFTIVSLACSKIENHFNITLSEDEISFILIHFQAAAERANMSKKIIVVVENRDPYTTILESNIRKSFVLYDVIETVERKKVKTKYINEFDFAIITCDIDGIEIPYIKLSSVISSIDLEAINKAYKDHFGKKQDGKFAFIKGCLDEESVFLHMDIDNEYECLKTICSDLYRKGCVDENFFESVMKRETISPTNIIEGVAIPHGIDKYVLKNRISIITAKKPISWGKGPVSVIFLLAINFSNGATSKKILEELYSIISESQLIEKIKECDSYSQILKVLS